MTKFPFGKKYKLIPRTIGKEKYKTYINLETH